MYIFSYYKNETFFHLGATNYRLQKNCEKAHCYLQLAYYKKHEVYPSAYRECIEECSVLRFPFPFHYAFPVNRYT